MAIRTRSVATPLRARTSLRESRRRCRHLVTDPLRLAFSFSPVRLAVLVLLVLPFGMGVPDAAAFRGWCRVDPEFQIEGQTAHVGVAAKVDDMRTARALSTGPIAITLTVPTGVSARYLAGDRSFGDGYQVTINHSDDLTATSRTIPVKIDAFVPMTKDTVPIRVSFDPAGSKRLVSAQATDTPTDGEGLPVGDGSGPAGRPSLPRASAEGAANIWISLSGDPSTSPPATPPSSPAGADVQTPGNRHRSDAGSPNGRSGTSAPAHGPPGRSGSAPNRTIKGAQPGRP
jgi:hypothetical protein